MEAYWHVYVHATQAYKHTIYTTTIYIVYVPPNIVAHCCVACNCYHVWQLQPGGYCLRARMYFGCSLLFPIIGASVLSAINIFEIIVFQFQMRCQLRFMLVHLCLHTYSQYLGLAGRSLFTVLLASMPLAGVEGARPVESVTCCSHLELLINVLNKLWSSECYLVTIFQST